MLAPFRMAADTPDMRQFIRHRQGIIHAISPNNGNTRFLKGAHFARGGGIVGALYNYQENAAQPPSGAIYHSTGLNALKINVVDANGVNHQSGIQAIRAGDKITIGTQSAYITATPGITSGVALVFVDSWPNYTNGQYSVTVEKGVLPYTTVAPAISGSNLIGSTLTCTPGTWAGKPTPSPAVRQWKADGVNISGETGLTYVIAAGYAGKNITCVETATSLTGTASSSSNQIFAGIVPTNITAPTVTGEGTPGEVLTCGNGTWQADPAATYTKQWRRDGSNISGQTADTYTVLAGDVGKIITCAVTAVNSIAGVTAISNGILVTAAVGNPPVNTSAPVISGTGQVGSILSLTSQGTWTGTPPITYTYQWQRNGANTGNTGNSYVVQAGDDGLTITCRVTGTNVDGVTNASSNGILCGASVFDPASLFVSGESGFIYDFFDKSKVFQGSDGTGAVVADGDPIGYATDLSGNANHGTAPATGKRPLYYGYADYDASDDSIVSPLITFPSGTHKCTYVYGMRKDANGQYMHAHSDGAISLSLGFWIYQPIDDALQIEILSSAVNTAVRYPNYLTPTKNVLSVLFDITESTSATEITLRKDGVVTPGTTIVEGDFQALPDRGFFNSPQRVYVGSRDNGTWSINGGIYRCVLISRELTLSELLDLEAWVEESFI